MRCLSIALGVCLAAVCLGGGAASAAAPTLTTSQVVKRFQTATGRTLAIDRRLTRPGHATALRLSSSVSNVALYGDFVVWVVAPGAVGADVSALLTDTHTGAPGEPGAAGIYWEQGTALSGGTYFLGKKRYGANLVLWRYGTVPKVDASFRRLHKLLVKLAAA